MYFNVFISFVVVVANFQINPLFQKWNIHSKNGISIPKVEYLFQKWNNGLFYF